MQSRTKKIEKSIYIYILNFKNCLFHSGAGISVSAGVGQAARGAVGFSDLTTDAKPSGDDNGNGDNDNGDGYNGNSGSGDGAGGAVGLEI